MCKLSSVGAASCFAGPVLVVAAAPTDAAATGAAAPPTATVLEHRISLMARRRVRPIAFLSSLTVTVVVLVVVLVLLPNLLLLVIVGAGIGVVGAVHHVDE